MSPIALHAGMPATLMLAAAILVPATGWSAAAWPDKPLRIVIPWAPGGSTDIVTRLLGADLGKRLGQQVIIENRAGGGAIVGMEYSSALAPDGHNFMLTSTGYGFIISKAKVDLVNSFAPVALIGFGDSALVVHPSLPVKTVKDLIALAKRSPGALNYSSSGIGGFPHLNTELFMLLSKTRMTHVPFKGAGPAIGSLLAGETHMYLGGAGLGAQHVKAGTLRALAVSGETRLKAYPEIPTFAEAGLGDANSSNWWGIVAPAGTPADIRERFAGAVDQAMKTPKVAAVLDRLGVTAQTTGPQAMARALPNEARMWARFVREADLSIQ
jgi:tripartite-type tricarboxylate transporter receptor subunit TctC